LNRDTRRLVAVDRATRRYAASLRQGSNLCRADGDSAGQTENFRDAFERASLRYAQIKEVLCGSGVMVCQFVVYRSFGLHVDKLCRDYSGETLRERVSDAMLRWQCYGCNPTVLQAIVKSVFALDVPNPSESCKP
jgi:hypothetical protein